MRPDFIGCKADCEMIKNRFTPVRTDAEAVLFVVPQNEVYSFECSVRWTIRIRGSSSDNVFNEEYHQVAFEADDLNLLIYILIIRN